MLGWVCINNPDSENLDLVKHLLDISYQSALDKFAKKK
jgi:predicted DNA-binding protein (MmcQ/YjbR family)